ncbi:hypothetical protein Afil01_13700 [Actinorhabdospora filicis]|uniref:NACHT domain-containing protein n=1 Tax=Actinorhabdospora filicis TaxID=1785913 RepID=A0A9W6SHU9_9ACTN|nr:hypothetical protein [Actinorhabdospora filicis]GLZ76563.1 hypothetical protein Afil01_13700 [Actinorhabdospora filicis]
MTFRARLTGVVLGAVVLGLLVNVASGELPAAFGPYKWTAWLAVPFAAAGLALWEWRTGRSRHGSAARTRRLLLVKQRDAWVRGVLDASMYREARVRLNYDAAIDEPHPWAATAYVPGAPPRPAGRDVTRLFGDEMHGWMLILGEPGSGKTTVLLELLRDLLDAAAEPGEPVPLMLNLSSWRSGDLASWAVAEAASRYGVPREHVPLELLLLDGLDEVAEDARPACVRAVNAFREAHPTVPVAVVSRTAEYAGLGESLRLRGRLEIRPLTAGEVDRFLRARRRGGLIGVLDTDAELRALVTTPLLLNVLMLTEMPAREEGDARERLLAAYVDRMLAQRPDPRFPPEKVKGWLGFLARLTKQHGGTVFGFDDLDGSWTPGSGFFAWAAQLNAAAVLAVFPVLSGWLWAGRAGLAAGVVAALPMFAPHRLSVRATDLTARSRSRVRVAPVHVVVAAVVAVAVGAAAVLRAGGFTAMSTGQALGGLLAAATTLVAVLVFRPAVVRGLSVRPRHERAESPSPAGRALLRATVDRAVVAGAAAVFVVSAPLPGDWFGDAFAFMPFCAVTAMVHVLHVGVSGLVEQRAVRRALARRDLLPHPAAPMLEHARACLLLRRVGRDWIFVHALIRDHLARERVR